MTPWWRERGLWVAMAMSYSVAAIGGALTELGPWYYSLKQPPWKPPDAWFGPIWTTIFTLAALSAWWAWKAAESAAHRRWVVLLFSVNALLNIGWSALFFAVKRPDWALLEWSVLWLSVASLLVGLRRVSVRAAWLHVPYLVWVSVAGLLNHANVKLNGPFNGTF